MHLDFLCNSLTTKDQFKHFSIFFLLIWPKFETKPNIFEDFNFYFLIFILKNYEFTNFHTNKYSIWVIASIKTHTMGIARGWTMSWNLKNRLNVIEDISKTILNCLKQLGKLHTHMQCYTCTKNQPIWRYFVKNFFLIWHGVAICAMYDVWCMCVWCMMWIGFLLTFCSMVGSISRFFVFWCSL